MTDSPTVAALLRRCPFPTPGTEVVCAVSGGADSLGLLALACATGLRVTAAHVDHGLRAGSAAEADVVAEAAARFGADFIGMSARVSDGSNLEARARAARHAVLPPGALMGHTMDDQAETVVLNLLRGAGVSGLAGIRDDGRHPLLALRRSETHGLCRTLGLEPVHDPSNDDLRFRRNRVRHELLEQMAAVAERDLVPVLARQGSHLAADAELLDGLAAALDPTDAAELRAAHPALTRRALRAFIAGATGSDHPPDAATVERALAVVGQDAVATDLGRGWRLARTADRLRIEAAPVGEAGPAAR